MSTAKSSISAGKSSLSASSSLPSLSTLTHLECSACKKKLPHTKLQNLCPDDGKPLLARYDLAKAAKTLSLAFGPRRNGRAAPSGAQRMDKAGSFGLTGPQDADRAALSGAQGNDQALRPLSMWRYAEVLPGDEPVTLSEGMTPILIADRLGAKLGLRALYVKDEGLNPTGSFKARGLSAAVTRARALGAKALATPTAGNAGGALAAYAAKAGIPAVIVMPADTPHANVQECMAFGADVRKLDGLISDCGKYVAEHKEREGWFEVTTLKEPYRIEGKKTMGYELWEQFGGALPDVIIYPTGGGVGLVGMCKAFDEMQEMGWIGGARPRMVSVQAAGCAPIVRAFEAGAKASEFFENAATLASGLRVPKAIGDFIILNDIATTHGTAIAATDEEMFAAGRELARLEGIFAAPEGAATVVAAQKLAARGWIKPEESVVLFNTGTGYKYSEAWDQALK